MKHTNAMPYITNRSAPAIRRNSGSIVKEIAPKIGPKRVLIPPKITITSILIDSPIVNVTGLMNNM